MRILIIGGGTGGWLTAARVKQKLPTAEVTLIESPNIPQLGVGESVVPNIGLFLHELGLEDSDWMSRTGSIYKLGNRFENWVHNKGEQQYFTFSYNLAEKDMFKDQTKLDLRPWLTYNHTDTRLTDYWLALRNQGKVSNMNADLDCQYYFMQQQSSPYVGNDYILNPLWSSSYHINADKLGSVVKERAIPLGVKHLQSHISDVVVNEHGVEKLVTDAGELTADYYLDCSGLGRLLIKHVTDSWQDYEFIPTKKCWVMPVKYEDPETELHNYTRSIAMNHGWRFKVTLYHRYGTGYCFDPDSVSDQEALDEMLQHVPEKNLIKDPRLLSWTPGAYKEPWAKNVIAVGLSAGFAEPMEANGLYLTISNIDEAWQQLAKIDKQEYGQEEASRRYNHKANILFNDTYEFIYPHYHLTRREDTPFWSQQKYLGMKHRTIDMVKEHYRSPINTTQMCADGYTIYPEYVWAGMAVYYNHPTEWNLKVNPALLEQAEQHFKNLNTRWNKAASTTNFYQWLKDYRFNGLTHKQVQDKLGI
jgi:tryptophan halogenase